MADVRTQDILLRVGGLTLKRYNCVAVSGASRLEVPITFTRADATSCATEIDRDGLLHIAAANALRTEWVDLDGDGVRETPGMLLEGTRTNDWDRSEEMDHANWSKTAVTVNANVTSAPDELTTADDVIETVATSDHSIFRNMTALSDNTKYT